MHCSPRTPGASQHRSEALSPAVLRFFSFSSGPFHPQRVHTAVLLEGTTLAGPALLMGLGVWPAETSVGPLCLICRTSMGPQDLTQNRRHTARQCQADEEEGWQLSAPMLPPGGPALQACPQHHSPELQAAVSASRRALEAALVAPVAFQEQCPGSEQRASSGQAQPRHQPHPPGHKGHLGRPRREPLESLLHPGTADYFPMKLCETGTQKKERGAES